MDSTRTQIFHQPFLASSLMYGSMGAVILASPVIISHINVLMSSYIFLGCLIIYMIVKFLIASNPNVLEYIQLHVEGYLMFGWRFWTYYKTTIHINPSIPESMSDRKTISTYLANNNISGKTGIFSYYFGVKKSPPGNSPTDKSSSINIITVNSRCYVPINNLCSHDDTTSKLFAYDDSRLYLSLLVPGHVSSNTLYLILLTKTIPTSTISISAITSIFHDAGQNVIKEYMFTKSVYRTRSITLMDSRNCRSIRNNDSSYHNNKNITNYVDHDSTLFVCDSIVIMIETRPQMMFNEVIAGKIRDALTAYDLVTAGKLLRENTRDRLLLTKTYANLLYKFNRHYSKGNFRNMSCYLSGISDMGKTKFVEIVSMFRGS